MPDFMSMRMSSPATINGTAGAALATAAEALAAALRQYQKTADLSTAWKGSASQAHNERLAQLADAATRVIQAISTARSITASGGAQLTALKTQNDAITASAMAGQFLVQPTGQVVPGPPHYAASSGPHGAALMKLFWTIANLYSGQINGTVAATTMTDAQVAATIAAIAAQFFSDLISDKGSDPAGAQVTLPPELSTSGPGTMPTLPGGPTTQLPPLPDSPGGTQLAGVGDLGGIGSLGPGGIGGLGAAGLVGGPGGLGGVGPTGFGTGGIGPGGVLAGGAGVIGSGAAGTMAAGAGGAGGAGAAGAGGRMGTAGAGMMPMMGMGAHGAASNDQGHSAETWLHEDRDPFDPGDDAAPDAVLS